MTDPEERKFERKPSADQLIRYHAYRTPSGDRVVADRWWMSGAPDGAPPAGWFLHAAHGLYYVGEDGTLTPGESPVPPLAFAGLRDLGPQPWCAQCDFGYDPGCAHS